MVYVFFLQKKQRTKKLSELFHSYNPYDHKVRFSTFLALLEISMVLDLTYF